MTPTEFLQAVWPDNGFYCVATPFVPPNQTKSVWAHKVFSDISDAVEFIDRQKETKDIYFCIHSLKEEKVWNPSKTNLKTGELGAYEIRKQSNTLEARAFFFDLDVGESTDALKKYASQADALTGLKEFCKVTGLPKPLIVSSGGGLHVYWLVEENIPSTEWRQYAHKLRLLANHHGLLADPARTTDTASVLRVAGTYNHKRGLKRPVKGLTPAVRTPNTILLGIIDEAIAFADIKNTKLVNVNVDETWSNLDKPIYDGPPVRLRAVIKTCGIMADLLAKRGNFSEPAWYTSLGIVQYCENGDNLIHRWSEGHPDYDPGATEAKALQWKNKVKGPASCMKLQDVCGTDICQTCPFYGKNANNPNWGPLVFARKNDIAEAPVVETVVAETVVKQNIPAPPKPYERLRTGEIVMVTKNKEGDEIKVPILPYDLYPLSRLVNSKAKLEQQMWRVHLPREEPKDFELEADALYDMRKFLITVANQGIYPSSKNVQHLKDYMIAYISKLQAEADAESEFNHLGWTDDFDGFVLPDRIIQTDGFTKPAKLSALAAEVADPVKKKGSIEKQIELLNFYNHRGYEAAQFMVLGGFASTLFYITGHHGTVINASGESGLSKSTSVYAAASIWGDPAHYTINGTAGGDTHRARDEKIITLANLPICIDEITHMSPQEVSTLVMNISQANGRRRLGKDGKLKAYLGGFKATLMLSSANSSLHNLLSVNNIAGNAGSMRVVEIYFKSVGIHSKEQADQFLRDLKQNYGHLGEPFIRYLTKNRAAVEKRVIAIVSEVERAIRVSPAERYWTAAIAVIIAACEIANELGFVAYDRNRLFDWCISKLIPTMRSAVSDSYSNPLSTLADYLEIINGDMLIAHKPHAGNIPIIVQKPRGQLLAHYDVDNKQLWLLKKGLKDFCMKIGANYFKIVEELSVPTIDSAGRPQKIIVHKDMKKVLGAGTEYAKAQSRCICLNMAHPDVSGVADLNVVVSNPEVVTTEPIAKLKPV